MQKEKIRVYILARELNIDSKDLLNLCKQAGFDVKNQLSSLEPEHRVVLEDLIKKGAKSGAAPKPAAPAALPDVNRGIPMLPGRPRPIAPKPLDVPPEPELEVAAEAPVAAPLEPAVAAASPPPPESVAAPAQPEPRRSTQPGMRDRVPSLPVQPSPRSPSSSPPPAARPAEQPAAAQAPEVKSPPTTSPAAPPTAPPTAAPGAPSAPASTPARPAAPSAPPGRVPPIPSGSPRSMPHLGAGRPRIPGRRPGEMHGGIAAPRPATPPPLKPLKPLPPPSKPTEKVATPIARLTKEHLTQNAPVRPEDVLKPQQPAAYFTEGEGEDENKDDKNKKVKAVPGRDSRQRARNERAEKRKTTRAEEVKIVGGRILDDDDGRPRKTLVHIKKKLKGTQPRKGRVELVPPISVRALSEALGVRSVQLLFKLREHGAAASVTINSIVEPDLAELLAVEFGAEIDIVRPADPDDVLLASFDKPENPEDLKPRAPIVTVMGHVDHGKTSLLDKIRVSNVVSTEAGGITQVIRAWRVEHGGRPVTFLDTPGHEAFTKMRARGAQVTDIAVIVVAADDGIMPQTEEAISHARAAGVSLVIAINKVDLPSANVTKTRQQLYGLEVLPDNMGGDTPFVETSAATGKGVAELLDQLSVVAELKELKANPNRLAKGTVLEASLSEGEGVRATLLIREGTLRRGDVILCGHAYGRVRQLYNDLGKSIDEAGPSIPVRITGLDEVPNADDSFHALPDLSVAREIAERRKGKLQEAALHKRTPLTLERLAQVKASELKIILKADFRGSIEAIKKELEKLDHDEVKVKLLHTAVGGITESDVDLALTSPEDTLVIGFNVVPDDGAMAAAEERGVQIRQYDIIYKLTQDIKNALEGKLKPREEVVNLGRVIVRDTFKISRVGTIAGCYVTQGTIRRAAKVRIIRDGVVIYPPVDRSAGLESLKRFKEDVSEVREGFECGIKVAGYDDIKVGDVIEAFRVDHVLRTLETAGARA